MGGRGVRFATQAHVKERKECSFTERESINNNFKKYFFIYSAISAKCQLLEKCLNIPFPNIFHGIFLKRKG